MIRTLKAWETSNVLLQAMYLIKEQQPSDTIRHCFFFLKKKSKWYFYPGQALTFMWRYIKWILILQLAAKLLTRGYAYKGSEENQNSERRMDASSPVNPPKTSQCERPSVLSPRTISFSHLPIFLLLSGGFSKEPLGQWQIDGKCFKPLVLSACIDSFNSQMTVFGSLPVAMS